MSGKGVARRRRAPAPRVVQALSAARERRRPGAEDLVDLASLVTGFAAREHLTIVPAVPEHDCGPEVSLGPDELGLPGFLELAGKLGGGVLSLLAAPSL